MTRAGKARPTGVETQALGRLGKPGVGLGTIGGIVGAYTGFLLGVPGGPLAIATAIVGGITGAVVGSKFKILDSREPQNRPIAIEHPTLGRRQVYVSASQWREIQTRLAAGVKYAEFPPELQRQFEAAEPPQPARVD